MENQSQSPLMRLPREIRDMIWIEALGGHKVNIHINQDGPYTPYSRCLNHTLCMMQASPEVSSASHIKALKGMHVAKVGGIFENEAIDEAFGRENESQTCCRAARQFNGGNILCCEVVNAVSLLTACKQLQDEAGPILYRNSVFCFNALGVLHSFLYHRTFGQLQQIQSLFLFLEEPYMPRKTTMVWDHKITPSMMLNMKGLKTLEIGINRERPTLVGSKKLDKASQLALKMFRVCSLQQLKVSVGLSPVDPGYVRTGNQQRALFFPKEKQDEAAEDLKKWLLDPAGKEDEMKLAARASRGGRVAK